MCIAEILGNVDKYKEESENYSCKECQYLHFGIYIYIFLYKISIIKIYTNIIKFTCYSCMYLCWYVLTYVYIFI